MKLHAVLTEPASVARILRHLGEPTEAPLLSPARGPPYYQSRVLRRRSKQHPNQLPLAVQQPSPLFA